jgi:hypothetical protein
MIRQSRERLYNGRLAKTDPGLRLLQVALLAWYLATLTTLPSAASAEEKKLTKLALEQVTLQTSHGVGNDLDFVTFLDYLSVFLWSLGLTKTGTDILAWAKSSDSQAA